MYYSSKHFVLKSLLWWRRSGIPRDEMGIWGKIWMNLRISKLHIFLNFLCPLPLHTQGSNLCIQTLQRLYGGQFTHKLSPINLICTHTFIALKFLMRVKPNAGLMEKYKSSIHEKIILTLKEF